MSTPTDLIRSIEDLQHRLWDVEQRAAGAAVADPVLIEAVEGLRISLEELAVMEEEISVQTQELVQARALLEETTQHYQELFDFAPDGYVVTDMHGLIREVNRRALHMLQCRPHTIIGKPLAVFISRAVLGKFYEHMIQMEVEGETHSWEMDLQPRRGQPFAASVSVSAMRDARGMPVGLRWLLRDISERRAALLAKSEQRRFAEALADVASVLNSTLEFEEVLQRILTNVDRVVPHDAANVMLLEAGHVRVVGCHGYEACGAAGVMDSLSFSLCDSAPLCEMASTLSPVVTDSAAILPYPVAGPELGWIRSSVGAPIRSGDEVLGFINLDSRVSAFFGPAHAERLKAFASQAATAIRNARRHQEAQVAAALVERHRLARDLHDAVSQTLWSASLIADVLPDLWRENPEKGAQKLEMLGKLMRGAQAEMRALLLEMLPSTLVEVGLPESLRRLAEGLSSRFDLAVSLNVVGASDLPPETQISLYRVVQEGLNNVCRHAAATCAEIALDFQSEGLLLTIKDDGRGFDPARVPAAHYGLSIMEERVRTIGGTFSIRSEPGCGTELTIRLPEQSEIRHQKSDISRRLPDLR